MLCGNAAPHRRGRVGAPGRHAGPVPGAGGPPPKACLPGLHRRGRTGAGAGTSDRGRAADRGDCRPGPRLEVRGSSSAISTGSPGQHSYLHCLLLTQHRRPVKSRHPCPGGSVLPRRSGSVFHRREHKWKARGSVGDLGTSPKEPRSTILSIEAIVVAFRRDTLLPLDYCLYAMQSTIPHQLVERRATGWQRRTCRP